MAMFVHLALESQSKHIQRVGIYLRIPDTDTVWVGHFNKNHREMTAAESIAEFDAADDAQGWEVVVPRRIEVKEIHDDLKVLAIFDKSRSIGIYPFHFVFGCFENSVYPTILIAFNMLVSKKIPVFDPKSYENLMDGVHHIVPPN